MSRIRTSRQAKKLRPIAVERARQANFAEGQTVFYGGICYSNVTLFRIGSEKPYRSAVLEGKSAMFFGSMTHAYPTRAEYEASGIHWKGAPA